MWTVSLRWLSAWSDRGRAPQRWSRRCVPIRTHSWVSALNLSCWSVHHLIFVVLWMVIWQKQYMLIVFFFTSVFLLCKQNIWYTLYLICSLMHLNSYSGGMTRPQPPTCCSCQRSREANLSACTLNQQSVRTPALHCTREYWSDLGPQCPKGFILYLVFTAACSG